MTNSLEILEYTEDEMIDIFTQYMKSRGEMTEDEVLVTIGNVTRVTEIDPEGEEVVTFHFDVEIDVEDDDTQLELPL